MVRRTRDWPQVSPVKPTFKDVSASSAQLKGATAIPTTGDFPDDDENDESLGAIEDAETDDSANFGDETVIEGGAGETIDPDEIYTGVDEEGDSTEINNQSEYATSTATSSSCSMTGAAKNGSTGGGTFLGLALLGFGLVVVRKRRRRA